MKYYYLLFLLIYVYSYNCFSQNVLTGTVKDENSGEALTGAVVAVKGTSIGANVDVEGVFSLPAPSEFPFTLVVEFAGYSSKEIEIYELPESPLSLSLKSNSFLDEVVVVGYGEQKRKDITGSVSSVPVELKAQPVASVERLLQGAVAGAIVTQTSGQPGGGVSVQIRGSNSITASSDPLYVIDGFPINNDYSITDAGVASLQAYGNNGPRLNPLSSINTSDIENIDVLKDASATAIYGSRGANGVILVTTKKGNRNKSSVTYDAYYGVQNVVKTIPLLNAGEYWQLRKDAAANTSANAVSALISRNKSLLNAAAAGGYALDTAGVGTDWQKAAFRTAPITSHNLSILTGTDKSRIAFAGNYFGQEGTLQNTNFKRYSARFSIDQDFSARFKVQSSVIASVTTSKIAPDGIVTNLLQSAPTVPVYKNDGSFLINSGADAALSNPINSLYNQVNNSNTSRFLGNISGEYKILEGLSLKILAGADVVLNKQNRYYPSTIQEGLVIKGRALVGSVNTINWLNENTVNFNRIFKSIHHINAVAGFTTQQSTTELTVADAQNFASDAFTYNNLGTAVVANSPGSNYTRWALASWLGRVNYSLADKYLLTLTIRSDGSSRFGAGNKWGYFPSAAVGWNLHNENFLKNVKQISSLKLRGSIGLTGNQSIPPYSSLAQMQFFRYSIGNNTQAGYAPISVANPGLGWEKTLQGDIGLDLGILDNRVNFVLDYYYKKTTDLLLNAIVSGTSGLALGSSVNPGQQSYIYTNLGAVRNQGIELSINTQNTVKAFKWNTIFIASANRNTILNLGNGINQIIPNTNAPSVLQVGQPVGSFIVYKTDGLIQPGQEGPTALTPQAFKGVGAQKYQDINGDGKITQAGDRVVIANNPGINLGLTNTFGYKGFDLTIFFQSSIGGKLYNQNRGQLELNNGAYNGAANAVDRWTPNHTNTDVKAAYQDPAITVSDRFIESASYVRLKNISFGYTIPASITSKFKVSALRLYVSAQNAWTHTKYTGYDPEVSQAGQSLINRGIDSGVYPNYKTILGGLSLTF